MTSRTALVTALAAVAVGLGAYALIPAMARRAASGDPAPDAAASSLITVQVGRLRRMTVHRYVTGYGVVEPAPSTPGRPAASASIAAPVTGVVTRVRVAAGEPVRRGQLLLELNSDAMTEALAAQEAARQEKLYAQHNTSLKALQNARARLALLRIKAPLSGTVVSVQVRPGEAVNQSTVLATIMQLRRLVVVTDVPAAQAAGLKPGERVELLDGSSISSRLAYVSPTVDPSDGAVMAWAPLPAGSGQKPGRHVRLRIVTATHADSLVAPAGSVVGDLAGHSALSVVRGHNATRMTVHTGLSEDGWIEVAGPGLRTGTTVVTVGAYGLPAHTAIQIVPSTGSAAQSADADPSRVP